MNTRDCRLVVLLNKLYSFTCKSLIHNIINLKILSVPSHYTGHIVLFTVIFKIKILKKR